MLFKYVPDNRVESYCDVEFMEDVILITERVDNPGRSVTNEIREIANAVRKKFYPKTALENLRVVEVYQEPDVDQDDWSYSKVVFDGYKSPEWKCLPKRPQQVTALMNRRTYLSTEELML